MYIYMHICMYMYIHIYQYILTIYILTNVNLLNLNNNLLMLFVCVVIKITDLLSTATRAQITGRSLKVLKRIFSKHGNKQFNTCSSNEIYEVNLFQTGYG